MWLPEHANLIGVPSVVPNKAIADGAGRWLEQLPTLVTDIEAEWRITVGAAFTEGTEAYVARATTEDGDPAVLKLLVPREGDAARHEITVPSPGARPAVLGRRGRARQSLCGSPLRRPR